MSDGLNILDGKSLQQQMPWVPASADLGEIPGLRRDGLWMGSDGSEKDRAGQGRQRGGRCRVLGFARAALRLPGRDGGTSSKAAASAGKLPDAACSSAMVTGQGGFIPWSCIWCGHFDLAWAAYSGLWNGS